MEAVEFPIAVNPDQTLEEIARDRGWKIITLPRIYNPNDFSINTIKRYIFL